MSELTQLEPEPVAQDKLPGMPISLPNSGNSHPYLTRTLSTLKTVQQFTVLPFSIFSIIHLTSVAVVPALFGPEYGNDLIGLGREIYQSKYVEYGILISTGLHVVSGILGNILKKYYNYVKYGKVKRKDYDEKEKLQQSMKIANPEDTEVRDINEGLGGISSIVGAGSRKSITYRLFGISPLSFSGYVFLVLVLGHAYTARLVPILVDGDSSMADLSYITHSLNKHFYSVFSFMNLLVFTGSYHMLVGWNRYLKQFSLKARRKTYYTIFGLAALGAVSMLRIQSLSVFPSMARRFDAYLAQEW